MDVPKVTNPEAKAFLQTFFMHRGINREYFDRVPEDKFDFRMVDIETRKSDTPRESLAHHINVEKTYILGAKTGELKFGAYYDPELKNKSKAELLKLLDETDRELIDLLGIDENINKIVQVGWNQAGVRVVDMLWSLNSHEILHTGWNLALMDHLNVERFPALKQIWG